MDEGRTHHYIGACAPPDDLFCIVAVKWSADRSCRTVRRIFSPDFLIGAPMTDVVFPNGALRQ